MQLYILRSIYNKNCFYPYQSQRLGTIFDLINVFSLPTEIVHNMPSIFVIGKGISEVKETVGMEHKVEKFLNYIGNTT